MPRTLKMPARDKIRMSRGKQTPTARPEMELPHSLGVLAVLREGAWFLRVTCNWCG
jgi:hypothetical protein